MRLGQALLAATGIVFQQIVGQIFDRVRWTFLDECGHALEQKRDNSLIQVRSDGKGL